jgi:hypothetical protein
MWVEKFSNLAFVGYLSPPIFRQQALFSIGNVALVNTPLRMSTRDNKRYLLTFRLPEQYNKNATSPIAFRRARPGRCQRVYSGALSSRTELINNPNKCNAKLGLEP